MAVRSRTRLEPGRRRAQLIELGLSMLAAHPPDQLPVDEIAAAANISRGLLFHYFPTKRDFHLEVVRAAAERLLAVTEPDPALPHIDRLRASLGAFVDYVSANRELYLSLVRGAAGGDPALQEIYDATRARVAERVLEGLDMSEPVPAVRTAARGWVGFIEEATLDWLRHRDIDRSDFIVLLEQTLLRAIETAVLAVGG